MGSKLESPFRTKIHRDLRKLGCVIVPIIGTAAGGRGWPDSYICSRYISFWIEFKGVETRIEPLQTYKLKSLRDRNEVAYVFRSPGLLQEPDGKTVITSIPNGFGLLDYMRRNHPNNLKEQLPDDYQ